MKKERKVYFVEFLEKLTAIIESCTTQEHRDACVQYIENYKLNLKDTIDTELYREAVLNDLNNIQETFEIEVK
jgi:hypothetical protein